MDQHVIFLGTGSSSGVPVLGCRCRVCVSSEVRNRRLRSSILIKSGKTHLLLDAAPDFRSTAIEYGISYIDTCFLTHMHFDHCAGVDDLRTFHFFNKKKVKIVMLDSMRESFLRRYSYLEQHCDFTFLEGSKGEFNAQGEIVRYFSYKHSNLQVMGLRYKNFAYLTDIKEYQESLFQELEGLEVLVIAATRISPSPLHLTLDEALTFAKKTGAKKVYLTHLSHEICYRLQAKDLPDGVNLAYDGLRVPI